MLQLIDGKKVAEMLDTSPRTVSRLAAKGALTAYRVSGSLRYKLEEVEAYVERQKVAPAAPPVQEKVKHFVYVPGMKIV